MAWALTDNLAGTFAVSGTTLTYPAGSPTAGALLVLGIMSDTVVSTPSGWTLAASRVNNSGGYFWYRVAGASEPGSVTITTSGDNPTSYDYRAYTGASSSPFDVAAATGVDGASGNASPALSLGPLAGSGELVVVFVGMSNIGAPITSPVWSTGFNAGDDSGKTPGYGEEIISGDSYTGTGTMSPSVTWSGGSPFNRYVFAAAFAPASTPAAYPAEPVIAPVTAVQRAANW